MKKLAIIILSSFIAASVFSFSLALAGDETAPAAPPADGATAAPAPAAAGTPAETSAPPVKVYYTEDIGQGGTRVYHVTYCQKAPSWGPVRCLTNADDGKLAPPFDNVDVTGGQCTAPDDPNAVLDMAYVRGCYKREPPTKDGAIQYKNEMGTTVGADTKYLSKFPYVDATLLKKKEADGGCADLLENSAPLYAPEWAVIKGATCEPVAGASTTLMGTVVWPNGKPDQTYIDKKFGAGNITCQMYRAVLCDDYDVLAPGQGPAPAGWVDAENEPGLSPDAKTRRTADPKPQQDSQCDTNNAGKGLNPPLGKVDPSSILNVNPTYSCSTRYLIMGSSGSEVLAKYISALYKWAAGLVGIISVFVIVLSGIQISAAGGDSAKLDTAKNRIAQSIIGLVILFLAGLILYTINPTFFVG